MQTKNEYNKYFAQLIKRKTLTFEKLATYRQFKKRMLG